MRKSILLPVFSFICSFAFAQWQLNYPDGGNIYSITTIGNTIFDGTEFGVYKSSDNGATWSIANSGLTSLVVKTLFVKGTTIYAGTNGGGIFISNDLAETWTHSSNGLTGMIVKSFAENEYGIFAGTEDGGVFVSTDEGADWTPVNNGISNTEINALTANGNTLYAGSEGSGIFISDDNGASWTVTTAGLASWFIVSLYTMDNAVFAGTLGGLYKLEENSDFFININGIIQYEVKTYCRDGSMLYVGSNGGGVYYSDDYGTTWNGWSVGLINKNIYSLGIYGTDIYAGTCCGFGLWKRPLLPYTGIKLLVQKTVVTLFPNPAQDYLNIELDPGQLLPGAEIAIFDLSGKLLLFQQASFQRTTLDISRLKSGQYILSIRDKEHLYVRRFEKLM